MKTIESDFDVLMEDVEAEAKAEGDGAVEELNALRQYYSVFNQVLTLRKKRGLTQRQLAEASGIGQSEISDIEHGKANPTFNTLQTLFAALEADLSAVERTDGGRSGSNAGFGAPLPISASAAHR